MLWRRLLDWFLPALTALGATGVLATGFYLALSGRFGEPLAPLPPATESAPRPGSYRIVALGDSITQGVGDDRGGYAGRLAEYLRRRGKSVTITNLAVSGAETGDLLQVIERPEAARSLATASLIVFSAGGNDLSHGLRRSPSSERGSGAATSSATGSSGTGSTGSEPEPEAEGESAVDVGEETLPKARANVAKILQRLRALNPEAPIRVVGIYNPFEVVPSELPRARAQLATWNAALETATHPYGDVLLVPIADLFFGRTDLLAGDRYHPGPRGHEEIADRVLGTLPLAR